MFIPKIILVLKMFQSFLESRIHKNVHFWSKHHFREKRLLYHIDYMDTSSLTNDILLAKMDVYNWGVLQNSL